VRTPTTGLGEDTDHGLGEDTDHGLGEDTDHGLGEDTDHGGSPRSVSSPTATWETKVSFLNSFLDTE